MSEAPQSKRRRWLQNLVLMLGTLFVLAALSSDLVYAWAAGAIVSSVEDLHAFLSALFNGQVISAESLLVMTANEEYGLWIARFALVEIENLADSGDLYGHGGGIPGYGTLVIHAPDTGKTAVWIASNEAIRFEGTVEAVAGYISQD